MKPCPFTLCIAIAGAMSCLPQIRSFHAEPNVVCQGTPVNLSWSASGTGVLSAQPTDLSLGKVPPQGERVVAPTTTTSYRLEVHGGLFRTATLDNTVRVLSSPSEPKVLAASISDPSMKCENGRLTIAAEADAKDWDQTLTVAQVSRIGDRALRVEHAAKTAELEDNVPSDVFRGTRAQGTWTLSVPLYPGESCGDESIPNSLAVSLFMSCQLPPQKVP